MVPAAKAEKSKFSMKKLLLLFPKLQPNASNLVGAMQFVSGKLSANSESRKVGGLPLKE